jgi:hypothetical protein
MEIGTVKRILKVEPEPFPLGHPENAPEEPSPAREPVLVPAGTT